MAKRRPKPTFTPVDDKVWHVDVVWEYGLKEEIPGFRSEAEAQEWIDHKSDAWLKANAIKREKTKKGRR